MKRAWVLLYGLLGVSCASTSLTPFNSGNTVVLDEEERRLWLRSAEEEAKLDQSGILYQDSTATLYVNSVAARLAPPAVSPRVLRIQARIIKNPLLNAFAYPNGVIYIHTGILSKMENEAQLAALLGHEMSHALYRHAMRSIHGIQNTQGILAALEIVTLPLGGFGMIASTLGAVGGLAAVSGYSRGLEEQADTSGLALMVSANYDPSEAAALFVHLQTDLEEQNETEPFLFGSHPHLQARVENCTELAAERYPRAGGSKGSAEFTPALQMLRLENTTFDLAIGRFLSARKTLTRVLGCDPGNARAHFLLGELHRQRGLSSDPDSAIAEYRQALDIDSTLFVSLRSMGLIFYKRGDKQPALEAFQGYLRSQPDAADRKYIEHYIEELQSP